MNTIPESNSIWIQALNISNTDRNIGMDISPTLNVEIGVAKDMTDILVEGHQIKVFDRNGNEISDTGRIDGDDSQNLALGQLILDSGAGYSAKVRVWTNKSTTPTEWSKDLYWEMGILNPKEWTAKWIKRYKRKKSSKKYRKADYLRRSFNIGKKKVVALRLRTAAAGMYDVFINGRKVSDEIYAPRFTSYRDRIEYRTDIIKPEWLFEDENVLSAVLVDGRASGQVGTPGLNQVYFPEPYFFGQIEIWFEDGSCQIVGTDEKWKTSHGSLISVAFKDGIVEDGRLALPEGWDKPGFNDDEWHPVEVVKSPTKKLIAAISPPVIFHEPLKGKKIGKNVWDFKQNHFGMVFLKVKGKKGQKVKINHAEVLDKKGKPTLKSLQVPLIDPVVQTNEYVIGNDGVALIGPYTLKGHGFRFIEITHSRGVTIEEVISFPAFSDLEKVGIFTSSNENLNRLWLNALWTFMSNLIGVGTDCPTRESMAWSGDIQAVALVASYIFHMYSFMRAWLGDMVLDQYENGMIPNIIPNPQRYKSLPGIYGIISKFIEGSHGWGDAATIVPWTLYEMYGDLDVLAMMQPTMKRWVDFCRTRADEKFIVRLGYNWQEHGLPGQDTAIDVLKGVVDTRLHGTDPFLPSIYFARSAKILAETSWLVGKYKDAANYKQLFERIRKGILGEFFTADGRLIEEAQYKYIQLLDLVILSEHMQQIAIDRTVALAEEAGDHVFSGFLTSGKILTTLAKYGHADLAYRLLLQESYPSWLYAMLEFDATTIPERWSAKDGSMNHFGYASGLAFVPQVIGGINPLTPGFGEVEFAPMPGGGLTHAEYEFKSGYGWNKSSWKIVNNVFYLDVTLPPNTKGVVKLPNGENFRIGSGVNKYSCSLN
jgi:alpha-L-rhamnosidase